MKTILALHSSADLYGSDRSLLRLVTGGLPYRFIVVVPYEGPLCDRLREAGAKVRVLPLAVVRRQYFHPVGLVQLGLVLLRSVGRIVELIRQEKVDLVMSNTTAVMGGTIASRLGGVSHVQVVRELIEKPRVAAWLLSFMAWGSACIVCNSEATRVNFTLHWRPNRKRCVVIHNGISVEAYSGGKRGALRSELGVGEGEVLFGVLGRISSIKGMDFFVEAAAEYLRRNPGGAGRFVVVGSAFSGQEWREEELESLIRQRGLGGRCQRVPFREDVADVLAGLDVLVVSSVQPESFGLTLVEAMAAGKPVIGTRLGGVPEVIVEGETGFMVAPWDVGGLAGRMQELAVDQGLRERMGNAGHRRVRECFSVELNVEKFGNIIAQWT